MIDILFFQEDYMYQVNSIAGLSFSSKGSSNSFVVRTEFHLIQCDVTQSKKTTFILSIFNVYLHVYKLKYLLFLD